MGASKSFHQQFSFLEPDAPSQDFALSSCTMQTQMFEENESRPEYQCAYSYYHHILRLGNRPRKQKDYWKQHPEDVLSVGLLKGTHNELMTIHHSTKPYWNAAARCWHADADDTLSSSTAQPHTIPKLRIRQQFSGHSVTLSSGDRRAVTGIIGSNNPVTQVL